jgi:elongation factor 1-beta
MASGFDVSTNAGLGKLNGILGRQSYIVGYGPTQDDLTVLAQLPRFVDPQRYPNTARWAKHISSFSPAQQASFPGQFVKPAPVAASAAPKKAAKKEAPKKATKKEESESEDDDESGSGSGSGSDSDFDLDDSDDDEETRAMLAAKADQIKAIHARQAAKANKAKSNLTLDIKPYDSETDMKQVEKAVRGIEMEGLKWLGGTLLDVAYGVKKLRIMCQLVDHLRNPDEIRDAVEEIEDVQSTDVFAFQMA